MQFLLTREDGSVLLTTSRSKENSLSSRRRRLDIDEKNHLHCTCSLADYLSSLCLHPTRLSLQPDLPCCQLQIKHIPQEQGMPKAGSSWHRPSMMMFSLRKGNVRSCCGQCTDAGVGLSKGAVAGHINPSPSKVLYTKKLHFSIGRLAQKQKTFSMCKLSVFESKLTKESKF